MSGFFRPAFRWPQSVQQTLATFTAATVAGGIQPTHYDNISQIYGPTLASGAIQPALLSNQQGFFAETLRSVTRASTFANASSFPAPRIRLSLSASAHANTPVFFGPSIRVLISAAVYGNSSSLHAPALGQPGIKGAPFVASAALVFAPSIRTPISVQVNFGPIGASVYGNRPRRSAGDRRTERWPNLPTVAEAPPWRLTVVTPDVARARARAQMQRRKHAQQSKRKRDIDCRVKAIFDDLVDDEVVRAVVRLIGEDA